LGDRIAAQLPQHLVAVHARHHDIEQDKVWHRQGGSHPQSALAAGGSQHLIVRAQQLGQDAEIVGRVVNNKKCGANSNRHGGSQIGI